MWTVTLNCSQKVFQLRKLPSKVGTSNFGCFTPWMWDTEGVEWVWRSFRMCSEQPNILWLQTYQACCSSNCCRVWISPSSGNGEMLLRMVMRSFSMCLRHFKATLCSPGSDAEQEESSFSKRVDSWLERLTINRMWLFPKVSTSKDQCLSLMSTDLATQPKLVTNSVCSPIIWKKKVLW